MSKAFKKTCTLVFLTFCFVYLSGCASQSSLKRELSSDEYFTLINVKKGDSLSKIAKEYLGDSSLATMLSTYNPNFSPENNRYVAIPNQVFNPSGVYTDGYQKVPILCYHQFTRDKSAVAKMIVHEDEFKQQMKFLKDNNYSVIRLSDVGKFIRGQSYIPKNAVVITIDDGYESYQDIALPILRQYGFHSTMFVYPDFVGAGIALNWKEIKTLHNDPLVDIQSHSMTHDSLHRRPSGESDENYLKRILKEVVDSGNLIAKRTGNTINQFAYPYGNTSPKVVNVLDDNNYWLAVTVHRGENPAFSPPLLLNRTMIFGGDSFAKFKRSLDTFESINLK